MDKEAVQKTEQGPPTPTSDEYLDLGELYGPRLGDVDSGPEPVRLSTGIAGLDVCLSEEDGGPGGLVIGASCLLSGVPGGGKSTIALAAAQVGETVGRVVYFFGEEKIERIKRRRERLGLTCSPIMIPMRGELRDAIGVSAAITAIRPKLVIMDSVQCLTFQGKRTERSIAEGAEFIRLAAQDLKDCTVIFLGHVTKSGNFAGASKLAHDVDVHLHIMLSVAKGDRRLEVRKNRDGRAGFSADLNLGKNGASIDVKSIKQGLAEARGKVEHAASVATDLLMQGKSLSGYDFEEAGVSGGVWRAGLEVAVRRLQKEGFEILDTKVKGRRTYQMANPPGAAVEETPIPVPIEELEKGPAPAPGTRFSKLDLGGEAEVADIEGGQK